jgi:hypothetical protein
MFINEGPTFNWNTVITIAIAGKIEALWYLAGYSIII